MRPKKTILCVDDNEQALSVRKFLLETRAIECLQPQAANMHWSYFEKEALIWC